MKIVPTPLPLSLHPWEPKSPPMSSEGICRTNPLTSPNVLLHTYAHHTKESRHSKGIFSKLGDISSTSRITVQCIAVDVAPRLRRLRYAPPPLPHTKKPPKLVIQNMMVTTTTTLTIITKTTPILNKLISEQRYADETHMKNTQEHTLTKRNLP